MLSTLIRTAQVAELAIYGLAAWASGCSLPVSIVAMLGAFVLLRLAIIAAEFAIAWLHRSPRAAGHRIGVWATVAMLLREWR